ncbi:MAG TPA: helix-turn-helix domain-containing protein [Firmicutes bacterium]|nr:helix-turn-helix domain-containing protein [Bacillota bacterium]
MVNLSKLSENLNELMNERGMNQSDLAEAMNTCSSKFSSYLTGKRAPNYHTFLSLLEFFHCSADFLLGLTEYPCEDVCYKPVQPFGERMRAILRETNMTQYAFAKQSNISWGVFYHWLVGKSFPSVNNLVKIAAFFDCSVDYLLGRV